MNLTIRLMNADVSVASLEEASRIAQAMRDGWDSGFGIGGTEWYRFRKQGDVHEGGKRVAHVSYNGRLWGADRNTAVLP